MVVRITRVAKKFPEVRFRHETKLSKPVTIFVFSEEQKKWGSIILLYGQNVETFFSSDKSHTSLKNPF